MTRRPRPARPTGFTLIELMVVVVLLALMASLIVPRLAAQRGRQLRLAADGVADLLTMFAQREQLSTRPVGIWIDKERRWLVLTLLDTSDASPDTPAVWQRDPSVRPVPLPDSVGVEGVFAVADGEPIDITEWPITSDPGKPRPRVEISLSDESGRVRTVVLPAHAIAPHQVEEGVEAAALRFPVDLDAEGRSREDW